MLSENEKNSLEPELSRNKPREVRVLVARVVDTSSLAYCEQAAVFDYKHHLTIPDYLITG